MILDLHRALVERWFHELFTLPHSTVLDQLVTDDFVTRDRVATSVLLAQPRFRPGYTGTEPALPTPRGKSRIC
jgi:hypothetical protein